jgi:hypothetical protein
VQLYVLLNRRASEDEIEKLENATRAAELHRRRVELELIDAQVCVVGMINK